MIFVVTFRLRSVFKCTTYFMVFFSMIVIDCIQDPHSSELVYLINSDFSAYFSSLCLAGVDPLNGVDIGL